MQTKVLNIKGEEVGKMNLNDNVFKVPYNEAVIHQVVVATLANNRQGTKSTLTRSEVSGGGRKPWRQKGTGNARQGSTRAPQWIKGGVVFAPKPRDFSKKVNKKVKELAFKSAISTRFDEKNVIVLDDLTVEPKTKAMVEILDNLKINTSAIIVTDEVNANVVLSARNLEKIETSTADILSTYDVVRNEKLIITKSAIKKIEEAYAE
ncbi:MAG: 50S ribosomal protein L4 [Clostridia bacterium]|nr:50S ribosomal protein L4 [Clostridia bacterium]